MIYFFRNNNENIIAIQAVEELTSVDISKLEWLFGEAALVEDTEIAGWFVGPRREMISPWSTNAVDICVNMNIMNILRMEQFTPAVPPKENVPHSHDPMLLRQFRQKKTFRIATTRCCKNYTKILLPTYSQ